MLLVHYADARPWAKAIRDRMEFQVPASGTINYRSYNVKTTFKEDLWVVAAEVRPAENRAEPIGEHRAPPRRVRGR